MRPIAARSVRDIPGGRSLRRGYALLEALGAVGYCPRLIARKALEIAAATDDLIIHADTALTLADFLLEGGRPEEAGPHAEDALALYEQKGNLVMAERVRQRSRSSQGRREIAPDHE